LTPAALNFVTWALMSWSVDLICASMILRFFSAATAFEPARPFAPYSPSK
jgi:hypothetical protein